MDQQKIGKFIASCRKKQGYLQRDIALKLGISEKTVSKWECGKGLPEVVYMEPLCKLLGITVNELLAGENIPITELLQVMDLSRLELMKQLEFQQLKMRLYKLYGIEIDTMEPVENGAGGLSYAVGSAGEKYIVKYPSENEMNHPEVEIRVCRTLLKKNIPACKFIPNKQGKSISTDENGRQFTLQEFCEGTVYGYNNAPAELQKNSALMLANIHVAMKTMEDIPVGIGKNFFKYRRPEHMRDAYAPTLQQAMDKNDRDIARAIRSNIRIAETLPDYNFDINKFTCGNTHGDYMISQLIWNGAEISAVIDWTCACCHPYIWEIVRSYIFMAPEVKNGEIDIPALTDYIRSYLEAGTLTAYDIDNAGNLFYYFLAVCNFFGQYYESLSPNRDIYLQQGFMASELLVWFRDHIDELNTELGKLNTGINLGKKLSFYYDSEGKLTKYPGKRPLRMLILEKLSACFEPGRDYTEKEVNDIIRQNISFPDYPLIRREMCDFRFIFRERDGSRYWRQK